MKKTLTLILALVLAFGFGAVSVAESEPVVVTIYPPDATVISGGAPGFRADLFKERGIELQIWAYSPERTNAILASGDLPDIMYVTYKDFQTMIDSEMILDLEPYLDDIPHVRDSAEIQTALNYTRLYRSNGTGKIYGIPTLINNPLPADDTGRNAIKVNWEVYMGIGMPEVNSVDDLIPLMKQMMEYKPVADDGTKTWGTVLNSGTDGSYWRSIEMWYRWFGYEGLENVPYLIETDMVNSEYSSILELDRDSMYYKGLKFYNECYLEGVLDPDSINNDRNTQKAKVETSHAIMVPAGSTPGWGGYRPIHLDGQELYAEMWGSPYGGDSYIVINPKTEHLDACLKFIDCFSDNDFYFTLYNGPESQGLWYKDENGLVMPTESGLTQSIQSATSGGDVLYADGDKVMAWFDRPVVSATYASTYYGPEGLRHARGMGAWPEVKAVTDNSEDYNAWRERFGAQTFTKLLESKGAYNINGPLQYVTSFCNPVDEWTQLTLDAIKDVIVAGSWKMVYCEDEAEFEAIWDQMMNDIKTLGGEDIVAARLAELDAAKQIKDSLAG